MSTAVEKEYLGDGVYVEVENGMFKVTTEDGIRATNTIFLEPEVYHTLVRYATGVFEALKHSTEEDTDDRGGEDQTG